jgi:ATP-binding cassette subfamily B protein
VWSLPAIPREPRALGDICFQFAWAVDGQLSEGDLHEAEEICTELGLADLLAPMPAALMQMVGETGWQLSPGERSRLYLTRALLQKARMVILEELRGA